MTPRLRLLVIVVCALVLALAPSAEASGALIDFEEARHPAAIDGTDATSLYEGVGVTFPTQPRIYVAGSLAHSGTQVLRNLAPAIEFGGDRCVIEFAPALEVEEVTFFAGLGPGATPGDTSADARAVSATGMLLASQTETLVGPGPTAISTRFHLAASEGEPPISQVTVTYSRVNTVVIDDLSFKGTGSLPPLEPVPDPELRFLQPLDGERFETVRPFGENTRSALVAFRVEVEAAARVNRVRIAEAGPSGTRTYDACGGVANACESRAPDFDFTFEWTLDYTVAGEYRVSARAYDDRGGSGETFTDFTIVVFELRDVEVQVSGAPVVRRPTVDNFTIMITVPEGRTLESVSLQMDDLTEGDFWLGCCERLIFHDTEVGLFGPGRISGEIELQAIGPERHHTIYFLRFPLPLWQVGDNRILVAVRTSGGPRGTRIHGRSAVFRFDLPSANWGIGRGPDGRLGTSFTLPGVPLRALDCPFVFCKDADQDGLLDLWENVATEVLHPELRFDTDEELFEHPEHHVRWFIRTSLVSDGAGSEHVLFRQTATYSRDYSTDGCPPPFEFCEPHNGDTQTADVLWQVIDSSEIQLRRLWANAHPDTIGDPIRDFDWRPENMLFTEQGILRLSVEEDKHGTWPSAGTCEDLARFDCDSRRSLRPPAINAGEPPRTVGVPPEVLTGRPFIDRLDRLNTNGPPYPAFVGIFPNEAVWTVIWINTEGPRFCGGLGDDGICVPTVGEKLRGGRHGFSDVHDVELALVTPRRG